MMVSLPRSMLSPLLGSSPCGHFFDSHRSSHCFIQKKLQGLDCKCYGNLLAIAVTWRHLLFCLHRRSSLVGMMEWWWKY
jgi:hypothetical protein